MNYGIIDLDFNNPKYEAILPNLNAMKLSWYLKYLGHDVELFTDYGMELYRKDKVYVFFTKSENHLPIELKGYDLLALGSRVKLPGWCNADYTMYPKAVKNWDKQHQYYRDYSICTIKKWDLTFNASNPKILFVDEHPFRDFVPDFSSFDLKRELSFYYDIDMRFVPDNISYLVRRSRIGKFVMSVPDLYTVEDTERKCKSMVGDIRRKSYIRVNPYNEECTEAHLTRYISILSNCALDGWVPILNAPAHCESELYPVFRFVYDVFSKYPRQFVFRSWTFKNKEYGNIVKKYFLSHPKEAEMLGLDVYDIDNSMVI